VPDLAKIVGKVEGLPTLPSVVARINQLIDDPNASAGDINEVISHDLALSAKILKLVNSAFYGFPRRISSMTHAVVILGFNSVRNIALTAFVFDAFDTGALPFGHRNFWVHSVGTAVTADALATRAGLHIGDDAFVAGLLHDLGKVRIPKDVLTKPGKLTDEEWVVMRRHPVDGARIIYESDRQLDLASAVAYEHHIMINGGGYPGRHFQRECHKASKLVHICDVYDALRTARPYREAWESDRVLANIQSGAGPDFDAELANAFITMMRQWERRVAVVDDHTPLPHMSPTATTPPVGTAAVVAGPAAESAEAVP